MQRLEKTKQKQFHLFSPQPQEKILETQLFVEVWVSVTLSVFNSQICPLFGSLSKPIHFSKHKNKLSTASKSFVIFLDYECVIGKVFPVSTQFPASSRVKQI